ncbi:hypothetical protein E5288_WYG019893 [Bos mutus]|uniref:Uncharacterized protein n=1 Tax=Bos mutus TaxID=72004 RepID=A0A6B0RNC1_9CETA|nr:hypothetical protein [Bos mutus]
MAEKAEDVQLKSPEGTVRKQKKEQWKEKEPEIRRLAGSLQERETEEQVGPVQLPLLQLLHLPPCQKKTYLLWGPRMIGGQMLHVAVSRNPKCNLDMLTSAAAF